MSLHNGRKLLRLAEKWPEGAAVTALRNIDTVSHKKHRTACIQINHCFLKTKNPVTTLLQQDELPRYHLNSLLINQIAPFLHEYAGWTRFSLINSGLITDKALNYYITRNTGMLTQTAGLCSKMLFFFHTIIAAILQHSGSRATFRHSDQAVSSGAALSSDLSAVLLPFPAIAIKNCTFLVYQPDSVLSSYIWPKLQYFS